MDTFPDLGSLSDQELKDLIQQLTEEEVESLYRSAKQAKARVGAPDIPNAAATT